MLARTACALFALSQGVPHVAGAQSEPSPAPTSLPEIGHVVTSDRQNETLTQSARTTYTVSKSEIIRKGLRTIADALEDLPGINLARYGGTGSLTTVGIRGTLGTQVLVLIDGMPAGGAQTGTIDLNSIPTLGVDRIEVVEGGGSTLYGSGSIGGIINIITKPLAGKSLIEVSDGSFGDRMLRIESTHVSFERSVAANNYPLPRGSRQDSDSEITAARFAFQRTLANAGVELSGGIVGHSLGVPGPLPAVFSAPGRQSSVDKDVHFSLSRRHLRSETVFEVGAATQQISFTCNDPSDPNCFTPNSSFSTEGRVQMSLRNTVSAPRGRFIYGLDLAHGAARVDNGGGQINVRPFAQTAIYAQQHFGLGSNAWAYVGVRGERDGALGGEFSPSLGVVAGITPALSVKANYATAFRAPNISDLYYPGFSNPHLQPERTRVADVTLSDANLLGGIAVGWFSIAGNNLIAYPPPLYLPVNIQRASIAGLTLSASTKPYHHLITRLNVTDLYRALDLRTVTRLTGRGPVLSANVEVGYIGAPHALVESAGVLTRNLGSRAPPDATVPQYLNAIAYTRLDAYLRIRLSSDVLLSLRAQNLGNERYSEVPGFPTPGRSFFVELSTR